MSRGFRWALAMGGACTIAACSFVNNLDSIGVGDGVPGSPANEAGTDGASEASVPDGAAVDATVVSEGGTDGGADACGPAGCTGLTTGLAAYWPFDNDYNDLSGHGLDLTVTSGSAQRVAAKFGNGYFAGLGADYLAATCGALGRPTSADLDLGADFTVSLWANRTANSNVDAVWYHYGIFDNGQVVFGASGSGSAPTPTYPTASFYNGAKNISTLVDNTFDFRAAANVGVWVHLIVFRRADLIGLRVNGHETTAAIQGPLGSAGTSFQVGHDSGGYPWQGVLDEVALWKRALTSAEMDALYNGGAGRTVQ